MRPLVLVTTLLSGEGPTGVETHFKQILHDVNAHGGEARLINPYTGSRLRRAFFRPLKNLKNERAALLYRLCQARVLQRQVRALLAENPGRETTIYAQCPLSARAALAGRGTRAARALMVVHYNVSEADEIVNQGLGRPDGPWASTLAQVERDTLPRLDGVVFGSDFMRRSVNARVPSLRAVPQDTIFNFAPALDNDHPAAPPDKDLVAIGTLETRKNQTFLLQMLAAARDAGHRYSLTLVGDGPDRAALERLTDSLGLRAQVTFAGFLPRASRVLPAHRALVHAAKLENCPLIIPEALAAGRPIFAAAVGGIPELFRDGIEGRFWDLQNPAGAARLVIGLLNDPVNYAAAAAAARARYATAFAGLGRRWLGFVAPALAANADRS